jgi:hypothetical protein
MKRFLICCAMGLGLLFGAFTPTPASAAFYPNYEYEYYPYPYYRYYPYPRYEHRGYYPYYHLRRYYYPLPNHGYAHHRD